MRRSPHGASTPFRAAPRSRTHKEREPVSKLVSLASTTLERSSRPESVERASTTRAVRRKLPFLAFEQYVRLEKDDRRKSRRVNCFDVSRRCRSIILEHDSRYDDGGFECIAVSGGSKRMTSNSGAPRGVSDSLLMVFAPAETHSPRACVLRQVRWTEVARSGR